MERLGESDEEDGVEVLTSRRPDTQPPPPSGHPSLPLLDPESPPPPAALQRQSTGLRSLDSPRRLTVEIPADDVEEEEDEEESIRRKVRPHRSGSMSRTACLRQRLGNIAASPRLSRGGTGGGEDLSRSPALSRSPYVDMMKTARHPHVLLSDLIAEKHPAALGAAGLDDQHVSLETPR